MIASDEQPLLDDENLLIVDIYLRNFKLAENVFIYSSPEATIVPLQPLFESLDFPIEVDPIAKKAHGWFISEDNLFDLSVSEHRVFIKDIEHKIPAGALIIADDFDLYVEMQLLQQWLPINIELESSRLRLVVSSEVQLPIERQILREEKRKRTLVGRKKEILPVIPDRYRLLGEPTAYFNVGFEVKNTKAGARYDGGQSHSMQLSGDVLFMEGRLSVIKSASEETSRKIISLYRRPSEPDEAMVARLSYAALGDIYAVSDSLIFSGGEGLGIDLHFGGVTDSSNFGKRIIEGDGPPGWEVELYRNRTLYSFQFIGSDGRYRFEDVPVEYGENIFNIRIYGPQGQVRHSRLAQRVGEDMQRTGKTIGRISYVDLSKNVVSAETVEIPDEFGNLIEKRTKPDEQKAYLQLQHGITPWLAAGFALATHESVASTGVNRQFSEINLTGAFPGISLAIDLVSQKGAGYAGLISGQTRIKSTSISFLQKNYRNFVSDRNPGGSFSSESELRLSGRMNPFRLLPMNFNLILSRDILTNGIGLTSINSVVGFPVKYGRLSVQTNYSSSDSAKSMSGRSSFTRMIGPSSNVRADISYSIEPKLAFTTASASVSWSPTDFFRTQLSFSRDISREGNSLLNLTGSYLTRNYELSATAQFSTKTGNSLRLTMEFSVGRQGKRDWLITRLPLSQGGRVQTRVFLDHDNDGQFSDVDEPLQDVSFLGRESWKQIRTDSDGIAYLTDLSAANTSVIQINEGSLEDPYWKSIFTKSRIVSHAGSMQSLSMPVVVTVEVEGMVSILRKGQVLPVAGLPVLIKDVYGKTIISTLTEFDGFFIISGLQPGKYILSIDPEALKKIKAREFEEVAFTADAAEGVIYLEDIILEMIAPRQSSAARE